jgi:hypothetical protein
VDLLELALLRFEQLAPAISRGMTPRLSDGLEAWLRGPVCDVAARLLGNSQFRGFARWSLDRLTRGSDSRERRAVEAVDRALADAARDFAASLAVTINSSVDGPEPVVVWLARRPWFDLAAAEDFFHGGAGLMASPSRSDLWGQFYRSPDPRVPLGDYVARAMFRRIDLLTGLIEESWKPAFLEAPRPDPKNLSVRDRLFAAKVGLDRAVAALRELCHQGDDARMRDACCTLAQVSAGYDPNPDLAWLEDVGWPSPGIGPGIRSHVSPPGEIKVVDPSSGQMIGPRRVRLCLPEVVNGVAGALTAVERLYRRPVEAEDLIDWLRRERRLVLVDARPRLVYWDGAESCADWDGNAVVWDLLWALALRARRSLPVHRDDLLRSGESAIKHRRNRLSTMLPGRLDGLIETVRGQGYRLDLGPNSIALLQLDDDLRLVEVGDDQMPVKLSSEPAQ